MCMMRGFRKCLAGVVLCALLAGTAGAAEVSSWAQEEIQRGQSIGLPEEINGDCRVAIDRSEFCRLSVNYLAMQMGYDTGLFTKIFPLAYHNSQGEPYRNDIFWDTALGSDGITIAYYMGVVEGRGDGSFDPNGLITRQEAATMMVRAYRALGGTLPQEAGTFRFADESQIAEYALKSVQALAYWSVLQGREDGRFAPQDPITIEEAMLCYIRLYEKAPVSGKNAPIPPMFSYEECLACWEQSQGYAVATTIQGPEGSLVQLSGRGLPRTVIFWCFLTKDGGMRELDFGVEDPRYAYLKFTNPPHFSEDGTEILADVYFGQDVTDFSGDTLLHEKGIYHVRIDVATLTPETSRSDLPAVEPENLSY